MFLKSPWVPIYFNFGRARLKKEFWSNLPKNAEGFSKIESHYGSRNTRNSKEPKSKEKATKFSKTF